MLSGALYLKNVSFAFRLNYFKICIKEKTLKTTIKCYAIQIYSLNVVLACQVADGWLNRFGFLWKNEM